MGNCLFGGTAADANEEVKVVTSNGGIMEFRTPITVEAITDEFPGHGIFRSHDLFWKPLPQHEVLLSGESYYLLPLSCKRSTNINGQVAQVGHVRSNSLPQPLVSAPYRMSFGCRGSMLKRSSYTEASCKYSKTGVWKVKLVISPEQLLEILSQEARTQELIESVRTVAKCGNIGVSAMAFSDQWSLSSSRNASSENNSLFEL